MDREYKRSIGESPGYIVITSILWGLRSISMLAILVLADLSLISIITLPFYVWFRILLGTLIIRGASTLCIGFDRQDKFTKTVAFNIIAAIMTITKVLFILSIVIGIIYIIIGIFTSTTVFSFPMLLLIGFVALIAFCTPG